MRLAPTAAVLLAAAAPALAQQAAPPDPVAQAYNRAFQDQIGQEHFQCVQALAGNVAAQVRVSALQAQITDLEAKLKAAEKPAPGAPITSATPAPAAAEAAPAKPAP
jgi:hypothetical protein